MHDVLRSPVRLLHRLDSEAVLEVCRRRPVEAVMVAGLLREYGSTDSLAGQLWGHYEDGALASVCWAGANLLPVNVTDAALGAFVSKARREGRRCSSLVGRADEVLPLWQELAPWWGKAREVRASQPLMVIDSEPEIEADPYVRYATSGDLDALIPASIAMFTEEVGYSPVSGGYYSAYARRVADLVESKRSFVRVETVEGTPTVVFKADVGALSEQVAQIQGVWVHPRLRGLGLAAPAMATVAREVQRAHGVSVSLYVNDFNERAIRAYLRAGFTTVGEFATVLF